MKSKSILGAVCAYLLSLGLVSTADAALIQVNPGNIQYQINALEPIGQSFTAEDQNIRFGFYLEPMNLDFPNDPVKFTLYEGQGFGGTVLDTKEITAPQGVSGFLNVNFNAINLSIGQSYTVGASIVGNSAYWGLVQGQESYAGGIAYISGNPATFDLSFRVTAIPVPSAIWLFGSGLIGLIGTTINKYHKD